jgi:hypothetical protein
MNTDYTRRSASAARQSGDEYQHLVAWNRMLRATLPDRQLDSVELEAVAAGNVDDVVLHYGDRPTEYAQVRFAVNIHSPLNSAYLIEKNVPRGTSVLQKFAHSWKTLNPGPLGMSLITNRAADPKDGALQALDGRSGLLLPILGQGGSGSAAGKARASWSSHLSLSEDELLEMLACLRFQVGRPQDAELETASAYLAAAGLHSEPAAVRAGIDLIRRWVLDGKRRLGVDAVRAGIASLGLQVADPAAILHVQSLLRDPVAREATEALDWVDLYKGEDPASRRKTVRPDTYALTMEPELGGAAIRLLEAGHRRILIRGAFRLPAAFAIGAALPRTRGTVLLREHFTELWSTETAPEGDDRLIVKRSDLGDGADIAVVLGITNDPTEDVTAYLRQGSPSVGALYTICPARVHDASVAGPGHAVAICQGIRDRVRAALRGRPEARVHLFLACPAALALFLGHRWNRVAPTVTYEDLSPGYAPAFTISA